LSIPKSFFDPSRNALRKPKTVTDRQSITLPKSTHCLG
jgi:hypothetical protein